MDYYAPPFVQQFEAHSLWVAQRARPDFEVRIPVPNPKFVEGRFPANCQGFAYAVQQRSLADGLDVRIWIGMKKAPGRPENLHTVPVLYKNGVPWVYTEMTQDGRHAIHSFQDGGWFTPYQQVTFGSGAAAPDYRQRDLPVMAWNIDKNTLVLIGE